MDDQSNHSRTLSWGIKDSFRDYLSRQADFSLNVYEGASVGAGNAVQFPLVKGSADDGVLFAARGHAVFRAHNGMMRLSLKDPIVTINGSNLTLALDFSADASGDAPDYFEVARLVEVAGENDHQRTFRAFLLPEATGMFNDMYEADSELDAVTVLFEVS